MNEVLNLFLLALLGSIIALFGGVVFLYNRTLSSVLEKYSVPFAAGVLVTVSILGLIPESEHEIGELTYWIVLVSFIAVYVFYTIEMPAENLQKVEQTFNITDEIIRFLITKPDLRAIAKADVLRAEKAKKAAERSEAEDGEEEQQEE